MPFSLSGIEPVTMSTYLPWFSAIALWSALSAAEPGRRHQVLLEIERDEVEYQSADRRVCGAQDRLRAPRAFLQREPHHAGTPLLG